MEQKAYLKNIKTFIAKRKEEIVVSLCFYAKQKLRNKIWKIKGTCFLILFSSWGQKRIYALLN